MARRDELLELLCWFEGDRIAGVATRDSVVRFMACDASDVCGALQDLVECHAGRRRAH
jgi:hypothetical protein